MPEFRVVLVMMPPLMVDLIRHVVAARCESIGAGQLRIIEIREYGDDPAGASPDIVILGPTAARGPWAGPPLPPRARVLTLSSGFTRLFGPEPGDGVPFTADALAERLQEIMRTI